MAAGLRVATFYELPGILREIAAGETLIEQVKSLHARALAILERAEAAGHLDVALRAIREVRGILELLGKLNGQLEERGGGQVTVRVVYVDKFVNTPPQGGNGLSDALDISQTTKYLNATSKETNSSRGRCGDQDEGI